MGAGTPTPQGPHRRNQSVGRGPDHGPRPGPPAPPGGTLSIGAALARLRQQMVGRLIRMKALDQARLRGRFVVLIDGTGYLLFGRRHCDHCLTQRQGEATLYMHQVLEAKLLGPANTVLSIATE